MALKNEIELANTREKLQHLESRYEELRTDRSETPRIRDLTMRSLKRLINQMKEEIALFEIHHPTGRGNAKA